MQCRELGKSVPQPFRVGHEKKSVTCVSIVFDLSLNVVRDGLIRGYAAQKDKCINQCLTGMEYGSPFSGSYS